MSIIDWLRSRLLGRRAKAGTPKAEPLPHDVSVPQSETMHPFEQEMAQRNIMPIDEILEKLSHDNLVLAREELYQWRRDHSTHNGDRPLTAQRCKCGVELQHWPDADDQVRGVWSASFRDWATYKENDKDSPGTVIGVQHDIRDEQGSLIKSGRCTVQPNTPNDQP